jgi:hypothetical protein
MNSHEPEDLNRLLSDAVSDIEPRSGIEAIRSRTSKKESPMGHQPRTWFLSAFGAAAATAAVITAVVVLGNNGDPSADKDPDFADTPSVTATDEPSSPEPSETAGTSTPPPTEETLPVYWVGETARGLGVYREWTRDAAADPLVAAVTQAVDEAPLDPDYRSGWPEAAGVAAVSYDGTDLITIDLTGDVHDRPAGMTEREAQVALEQLVYTAQAVVGEGRKSVQFLLNGSHSDQVLGQPTSEPLANGPLFETLSLVNIDSPAEGDVVTGDTLEVSGVANSFEANVVVKLQRYEGTFVVFEEGVTALGSMGTKLFPFEGSFDISDLEPGQYILTAMTDDPSGGAEGFGPDTDTKVITIQ